MKKTIWEFVAHLQGRNIGTLPTVFADSYQRKRFEDGNGIGPTTENYVFDLIEPPLGRWNRAFVEVGVKAFIQAGKADASAEIALTNVFFEHFKRLREDCKARARKLESEAPEVTQVKKVAAAHEKNRKKNKVGVSVSAWIGLSAILIRTLKISY